MSCWIPSSVSQADLGKSISATSKRGEWRALFALVKTAREIPANASAEPLSPEVQAFQKEMISTAAAHGMIAANDGPGCIALVTEIAVWDGGDGGGFIVFTVDLCADNDDDDVIDYLIDNGYSTGPYVAVESDEYEAIALDSVKFTAEVHDPYPLAALGTGWVWTPDDESDLWTTNSACSNSARTCTMELHGSGTINYTAVDTNGDSLPVYLHIGVDMPDTLDEGAGDIDISDAPITTASGLTQIDASTGLVILGYAEFEPQWVYTQGCYHCNPMYAGTGPQPDGPNWEDPKNLSNRYGDCTDFVWTMIRKELSSTAWPFGITRTSTFEGLTTDAAAQQHGFVLTDSAHARRGDVVVTNTIGGSGHAGIFAGMAVHWHPIGEANNGSPTTTTKKRHRGITGRHDFKSKAGEHTLYFRVVHY